MAYTKTGGMLTIKGLDTSKPAEYIDEQSTPNVYNMTVNRSVIKKRVGSTLMGLTMSEEVMVGREFIRAGVKYVVRIGLDEIHEWNDSTLAWDDVTGADLTGTTADPIDTATPLIAGSRVLTFTNNIDNIRKYTGTGNTADLAGSPPKCKFMVEFGTYLLLANVNDGTARPMRVQWSDTGDPETWAGGNTGSKDLVEDGKDITGLAGFGAYVSVHTEGSIYLGYLVTTSNVFKFDRKNTGAGTICNATIQSLPTGEQAFLATDGIRLFNGISAPLIESPVTDDLREGVNSEYVHKSWSVIVPELDEYWCAVPMGSDTTPNTIFKYNYRTKACFKDTRDGISAAWQYSLVIQPTWQDQTLTWDQATARWDDRTMQKLFPIVVLGDNTGLVYERNASVNDDNGIAVDAAWETMDYQSEEIGRLAQWVEMELWAKGNSVTVSYSTDKGQTWTPLDATTLSADYPDDDSPIMLYFDVVSTKIRFRFRNNVLGETFYIKQFNINYRNRELRSR